jgi:hypothetical protein
VFVSEKDFKNKINKIFQNIKNPPKDSPD